MAELYNVELRTGCFCNQGACQAYLDLSDQDLLDNLKVCALGILIGVWTPDVCAGRKGVRGQRGRGGRAGCG